MTLSPCQPAFCKLNASCRMDAGLGVFLPERHACPRVRVRAVCAVMLNLSLRRPNKGVSLETLSDTLAAADGLEPCAPMAKGYSGDYGRRATKDLRLQEHSEEYCSVLCLNPGRDPGREMRLVVRHDDMQNIPRGYRVYISNINFLYLLIIILLPICTLIICLIF